MQTTQHRIPRPRYQQIIDSYRDSEHIKVFQGVRRCGKSTLLAATRDGLLAHNVPASNIFSKRFDEFGLPFTQTAETLTAELSDAFAQANPNEMFYVFLDEIQEVNGWERVVRGLHTRPRTDVYITGSNAHMLSSDLATLLAGRYVKINVHPLSFEEYLAFLAQEGTDVPTEAAFADYMRYGGMPSLFALRERTEENVSRELSSIMDTVVLNDVARRVGARDIALLQRLVAYVFSTSGNLFSTNKVAGAVASSKRKTSSETIDNYLDALKRAFVIQEAPQTGIQGKSLLNPLRKFYPVDLGLRNLASHFSAENTGFQLENIVFNELVRREYAVEVGTLQAGEIDFVARKHSGKAYIQVCETIADERTRERELAPLRAVRDSFPKAVLTLDRLNLGVTDDGIHLVNAIDWLLERDSVAD